MPPPPLPLLLFLLPPLLLRLKRWDRPPPPLVLRPGLVLLRSAVPPAAQRSLAELVLSHGHRRHFWVTPAGGGSPELNNARQGRGRIYAALASYPRAPFLAALCASLSAAASGADAAMPGVEATHLLSMYYARDRRLGWHRDDGANDGASEQPVVSLSLGDACDFLLKDEAGDLIELRLESGDALLFGGPARWIRHSVAKVHAGTCPAFLLPAHEEAAREAPEGSAAAPKTFRLNLTFRNAPELFGREGEEKFHYFAKSARKFAEGCKVDGVEEARRKVVEGRRGRKEAKKKRREERGVVKG